MLDAPFEEAVEVAVHFGGFGGVVGGVADGVCDLGICLRFALAWLAQDGFLGISVKRVWKCDDDLVGVKLLCGVWWCVVLKEKACGCGYLLAQSGQDARRDKIQKKFTDTARSRTFTKYPSETG